MEPVDYGSLLRRRLVWVVGGTLIGLAAGLLWALFAPKSYSASSELYVGNAVSGGTVTTSGPAQSASQYVLSRMPSYAALLDAQGLADQAAATLPFSMSGVDLAKAVQVSTPAKTVLLQVTAQDGDSGRAADIANAAGDRLRSAIEVLEVPVGGGAPPVKVTVISAATPPRTPSSPQTTIDVGIGLVLGLGAGLLVGALRDSAQGRSRTASLVGAPAVDEAATGAERVRLPNVPADASERDLSPDDVPADANEGREKELPADASAR